MALVPITIFGSSFTSAEVAFLTNLADHSYTDGQLAIGNTATHGISFNTITQGSGILITNGNGTITIAATAGGGGTVTSVGSADGSITVTNATTTPDLAVVKAPKWSTARTLAGNSVDGSANVAFTNKVILQGTTDAGFSSAQFLGALTTGIVKNTTTTGVLSIAVAADFPTLNQNTTGSAATLTTSRTIGTLTGDGTTAGSAFNGSANNTNALVLATVNSNVGSFTYGSFTVNGKGLITAASSGTTPYVPGGTDVALADGGTGASLVDPNANNLMGWDDTDNAVKFITIGSGLTYTHATHTLSASGGGGTPGGSDTQVQFNDSGSFGGDADFTWNKTSNTLTLASGSTIASAQDLNFTTAGDGGSFGFTTANGTVGAGGSFVITLGTGFGGSEGGDFMVQAGVGGATNGPGGVVQIQAGNGAGSGDGGSFDVTAGNADLTGNGGSITFVSGEGGSSGGNGGDISFNAIDAQTNANGGNILFQAGLGQGTGVNGKFKFTPKGGSTVTGVFDFDSLSTTTRTYTWPDKSGTVAMLSDITGGGGITWTEVTGTSQSAAINNGYITNNAGLVTVTLPSTAAVGSIVEVGGKGAGLWKVAQNASGQIHFGNQNTTSGTGGSIAATNRYDAVRLICIVANNEWVVLSSVGNITIV